MDKATNAYKVLGGKIQENTSVGKPRRRSKVDYKIDT
jgi:hypothetical protein